MRTDRTGPLAQNAQYRTSTRRGRTCVTLRDEVREAFREVKIQRAITLDLIGMGRKQSNYCCVRKRRYPPQLKEANAARQRKVKAPRSLAVLCKQAIIKYKLLPEKKKFAPPETFFVVGGKPLRKRPVKPPPEDVIEAKRTKGPKSLLKLCQAVIKEYNMLPECEETKQPTARANLFNKKNTPSQRGKKKQSKSKGRPRKDKVEELYSTIDSQTIRKIKEEDELILNQPLEDDPLDEDKEEHFTVVIKEENIDIEYEDNPAIVQVPQATEHGLVINSHFDQMPVPGPSTQGDLPTMLVIMDEFQVFANRIAEQLRALPVNRALLLELDIQSMIDNETQLLTHEN